MKKNTFDGVDLLRKKRYKHTDDELSRYRERRGFTDRHLQMLQNIEQLSQKEMSELAGFKVDARKLYLVKEGGIAAAAIYLKLGTEAIDLTLSKRNLMNNHMQKIIELTENADFTNALDNPEKLILNIQSQTFRDMLDDYSQGRF